MPSGRLQVAVVTLGRQVLASAEASFRAQKRLADRALAQLAPEQFHARLDPEANSVAILIQHLAGNMRSRWSDPLRGDGERASRDRDAEFVDAGDSVEALLRTWERGWGVLFGALAGFDEGDLSRTVTIRGEPHTLIEALNRQLTHYAHHVGQIVLLAKHLRGDAWETLSIPRGGSAAFNAAQGVEPGGA